MQDLWFTGETRNQFIFYIGGLFLLLYGVALLVGYTQRRCQPNVVALTTPEEGQVHEYILVVKTSLLPYSGCASTTKVFVQLQGQFHNSPFYQLKKSSVTNEILTRGAVDIFVLHTTDDLGNIDSVGLEVVDEVFDKSVWRLSGLEVYAPSLKKLFLSKRIRRLVCQQKLECHVMLSSKKGSRKSRQWGKKCMSDILTEHQWLSLTNSAPRFGSFTAFLNLQLSFCVLALFLAANLLLLLITEDANLDFDITYEKMIACILTTVIVVALSWILEAILRNLKPWSKLKRSFFFKGLNELRERNIDLEKSDNEADLTEETAGAKSLSQWNEETKSIMTTDKRHNSGDGRSNTQAYTSSSSRNDLDSARERSSKLKVTEPVNRASQNWPTTSENLKEVQVTDEDFMSCIPHCCNKKKRHFSRLEEGINSTVCDDQQFSNPLELAQLYAKNLLSSVNLLFAHTTLDTEIMKECFHRLQKSLSTNLMQLLTKQLDSQTAIAGNSISQARSYDSRIWKCRSSVDSLKYRYISPHIGPRVEKSSSTLIVWTGHSLLQETEKGFENTETSVCNLETSDQDILHLEEPVTLTRSEELQSDSEQQTVKQDFPVLETIEQGSWLFKPKTSLSCYGEENDAEVEFGYCICRQENCKKCLRLQSVVREMSYVMMRNCFSYNLEMSFDMYFNQYDSKINEIDSLIQKKISEAVEAFVYDVKTVIEDTDANVEVDVDLMILQSASTIITHHTLKNAVEKLCHEEKMQQIKIKSKTLVTSLVEDAVAELEAELQFDATVKRICSSATHAAMDEVWTKLQDPVYVFAESLLKETTIQQIREKCGGQVEETQETPLNIDPAYEVSLTATLVWVRTLDEIPESPECLLIQSLIDKFENEVNRIFHFFETMSEYTEVEWKIGEICLGEARKVIQNILWHMKNDYSVSVSKGLSANPTDILVYLDIHICQTLDSYVDTIKRESKEVLNGVLMNLISRSVVQLTVRKAELQWKQDNKNVKQNQESVLESSEIQALKKGLGSMRGYLGLVYKDNKQKNEKDLTEHIRKMTKKKKGYVSVNLQNILDSYYVVDDIPRDYTEEELYVVEWFVSGDLTKILPASLKPVLVILILGLTLFVMVYVILKGVELTVEEAKEWTCLTFISCGLFVFVFEPLKVLMMMCIDHARLDHPDYS